MTVGPTGTFTSLTQAVTYLTACGYTGNIILELQSTYVSTVETFPITFNAALGSGSTKRITIRPATGATGLSITSANTTATINLNGGNYITFDGRPGGSGTSQLTIANTSTATGGTAVRFINDATNNTLQYVTLSSLYGNLATPTTGVVTFLGTTGTTGNDNNTIDNCNIDGGAGATASPTLVAQVGIYSSGQGTGANDNSGNIITNNNIYNFYSAGQNTMGILIAANSSAWTITGNKIYQTSSRTATGGSTHRGINIVTASGGGYTISNNIIGYASSTQTGTLTYAGAVANRFVGIEFTGSTTASSIQGNTISGISLTTSSGATTGYGIFTGIYLIAGTVNVGTTTANTIGAATGNGAITITNTTNAGLINGIYVAAGASTVQNNIIGGITATGTTAAIGFTFAGINVVSSSVVNVSSNLIGSASTANSITLGVNGTTTAGHTFYGILNTSTATPQTMSSNSIRKATLYGTGATTVYGIYSNATVTTLVASSNNIFDITTNAASGSIYGIAAGNTQYTMNSNQIYNLSFTANSGTSASNIYGIYDLLSPTAETIDGNQIHDFSIAGSSTSTSHLIAGIYTNTAAGTKTWSNNTIYTFAFTNSSTGTATIHGIFSALSSPTISKNKIYDLSAAGATSTVYGITISSGTTVTIHNNYIGDLRAPAGSNGTNDIIRGINLITTSTSSTVNLFYNTIYINASGGTNFTTSGIYHTVSGTATTAALNMRNNIIVNNSTPSGSGLTIAYRRSAGAATNLANYASSSDNNLFYAGTPSASRVIYYDGTSTGQTLANYKSGVFTAGTIAPRDANSVTENPTFLSTTGSSSNFLHIDPSVVTVIESGAVSPSTSIYNTDYDGDIRQGSTGYSGGGTAPDIGADEFTSAPSCASSPSPADAATGVAQTTSLSWAAATNATSYDVYFGTDNPPTNIENGTNQSGTTYTPGSALAASTTYYWKIVPKNSVLSATGCSVWSFTTQAAAPTLTTSSLTAFSNQCLNVTSTAKIFTMNAVNLTGTNVTITAPTDFTVSEDDITYTSSINVNHSSGAFSSKTIYVKFTPTSLSAYSDNIVISGGGLSSSVNVPVSGTVVNSLAGLSYTTSSVTYCTATAITANSATLATSGGTVTYSVLPALPSGLTLNTSTGQITGNPSAATAAANYVITASNGCSSTTATVNITVIAKLTSLTYTSSTMTVCANTTVTPNTVSAVTSGAGTITYTVLPALPTGLGLDASTGTISGTPTVPTASASYVITVSNSCSSTTASVTIAVNASLNGTYTVGASGNYATLTAAVAAYNAACLTGPVVFSLTDATYSGSETFPITINANTTASSTNTLTIKPTGTSAISGSNATALIVLNGADYVTLDGSSGSTANTICPASTATRSLTITNSSTGTSSAVAWIQTTSGGNSATNNTIRNCNIVGSGNTQTLFGIGSGGTTVSLSSLGTSNNNNSIINNNISKTQYGIYSSGISNLIRNSGTIINQNLINTASPNNVQFGGIVANYESGILVSGNIISNIISSGSTDIYGINLGLGTNICGTCPGTSDIIINATVSNNIIGPVTQSGTYSAGGILLGAATSGTSSITNNIVYAVSSNATGADVTGGIIIGGGTGSTTNVYYNTVSMQGAITGGTAGSSVSACFMVPNSTVPTLNVFNNIFSNTQTGNTSASTKFTAVAVAFSTYTALSSDNNDLYAAGAGPGSYQVGITGGVTSGTPVSRTTIADWRTQTSKDANSKNAAPVFTSSTDLHIDYSNASNLSNLDGTGATGTGITTDIDCDARDVSTPDIGADEFVAPANDGGITGLVSTTFCPGSQSVQAVLRNFGTATLTSATINWTVNGVAQTPVSWTGSIASGATANVTLGNYTFAAATSYVIVVTSSLPNGVADPTSSNNTFTSASFQTALTGTYTVGAAGNYTTLTAAVAAANAYGLCGPTIFSLIDATYSGSETFPIIINQLTGASAVNTLTIKPASGVNATITGSNAAAIIKLNGADYITIDGSNNGTSTKNLTISNSNTGTSSAVVWLASVASPANGATNNTVKNAILTGQAPTTTFAGLVSSGSAIGGVAEAANASNTFQNNTVNTSIYGIAIVGVTGNESGNSITNNTIGSATAGNKIGLQGIFVAQQQNVDVSGNTIFGVNSSTNINTAGIYVTGTISGGSISKNNISDIKNTTVAGRQAFGIWLNSSSSSTGLTLSNNFVYDISNTGANATLSRGAHGIAAMTGGGYNVYYNSVLLNTTPAGTIGINAALYVASGVTALDIRNNIFSNAQTTGNRYAIYSDAANTAYTTINYNDYASAGTAIGYIGSARTGISDVVTGFGQNANSVSITPVFSSATDLHIVPASNPLLDNLGTSIGGITTDIDGDTRSGTTPDIGADEFVTPACSVANGGSIAYGGTAICNSGTATLTGSGYSYGSGTTYQWLVSTDNFVSDVSNVSGGTSPSTVTTGVLTATSYFKLRVVCGTTVDTAYSNTVTVTVNNPSVTSATDNEICSTGTMVLGATGSIGTTLNWYDAITGGTLVGTGTSFTTPSLSVSKNYYVEATLPAGSNAVSVGAGGTTGTGAPFNPANGFYGGMKGQYLFTAAELTAAGISAGNITNLGLDFTAVGSTLNGFNIQIGTTALSTFATPVSIQGSLTTVYTSSSFTPVVGVNNFALTPFNWNGTSNLIVSISWSNNNSTNTASTIKYDATTNYASQSYRVDNETAANVFTFTGSTSAASSYTFDRSQSRPKMIITGQVACASSPRTLVKAVIGSPVANPTVSPLPVISICQDSILTLTASGSTPAPYTVLYEGFEGGTFPPSTFDFTSSGDGDYFQSSSYYYEGSNAAGLYSETDLWDWLGFGGSSGNVSMTQVTAKDLTNYSDVKLSFYHICATEDGYDFGRVQYNRNDGNGWQDFPASAYTGSAILADANTNGSTTDQVAFDKASYSDWDATFTDNYYDYLDLGATGYDPGNSSSLWKRETIDLTPFASNSFRVRFRMTFDDVVDYYSWLIDSVAIIGTQTVKYAWSPNTALFTNTGATTAYDSITNPDQPTVYAKPNDTTTYRAIAYIGSSPNSYSGVTPVTVNVSKKPTATIEAAKPFLCDATAELSASAVVPPSSTLNWTKASGTGSSSATGNPATVSGLAGTTVYNVKGTNGVCVDIPIGTSTVVLPATDNSNIATSPSAGVSVCNYCVYSDGNTKTYYNSTDGKIIASITDETANSASLGETEICFKVDGSVQTVTDNLGNTQPYLERVWTIHPAAGSKATVTLYFTGSELNDLQTAANSGVYQFSSYVGLGLTKYSNGGTTFTPNYTLPASSGGVSVPVTFSSFNGTDHQVQFTVDDFSTFYIHPLLYPNSALPVELVSFTGWNAGEKNELEWKTASELNTLKFVVEKKIDGGSFTYLGELPAAGNSSQLLTYNFSDLNPVVGNNYYRLKIIDTDGKFSYSNIINIPLSEVLTNNFVSVFPNPTGGKLNVGIQSTAAFDTKVVVYDVIGTKMFEQSKGLIKGLNTIQFDFTSFAKGAYILHFTDNTGKTHTTKFVKD